VLYIYKLFVHRWRGMFLVCCVVLCCVVINITRHSSSSSSCGHRRPTHRGRDGMYSDGQSTYRVLLSGNGWASRGRQVQTAVHAAAAAALGDINAGSGQSSMASRSLLGERTSSGAVPLDENRVVVPEVVLSSGEESTAKTGTAYVRHRCGSYGS
jgi:hypothetical protein